MGPTEAICNLKEEDSMPAKTSTTFEREYAFSGWHLLGWTTVIMAITVTILVSPRSTSAASTAEIDRDVTAALQKLLGSEPAAKALADKASGILVFPSIVKGGFIIGGMYGEGALRVQGKTTGYYNAVAASYGLQAGGQAVRDAGVFMNEGKLKYLGEREGWGNGGAPSPVGVDKGGAGGPSAP